MSIISKITLQMINTFVADPKRVNHALKVYGYAMCIAEQEPISKEKQYILALASILHDIGIPAAEKRYGSCEGVYQEKEGPGVARAILENEGIERAIIDRVCYLIGNHHTYTRIDDIDFQILVESDFLVNAYEESKTWASMESIRDKIFKTQTGIDILESLFQ